MQYQTYLRGPRAQWASTCACCGRRGSVPDCSWRCALQAAAPQPQPAHHHRWHYVPGGVAVSTSLHHRVPARRSCLLPHHPNLRGARAQWASTCACCGRRGSVPDCSWRCALQHPVPGQQPAHHHRWHYVAGGVAVSTCLHHRVPARRAVPAAAPRLIRVVRVHSGRRLARAAVGVARSLTAPGGVPCRWLTLHTNRLTTIAGTTFPASLQ
jgi:hypothetical protein